MPFYAFMIDKKALQAPIAAGVPEKFVVWFPGSIQQVVQFARQNGWGSPQYTYAVFELRGNLPQPQVICVQISFGGAPAPDVQAPQVARAPGAAQPAGAPVSQPGRNAGDGNRNELGFQPIGDAGLSGAGDGMFGEGNDGTFTDLVDGGRQEQRR